MFNPFAGVAPNMHESHLLDLADVGAPLPLTRLPRSGDVLDVAGPRTTFGTTEVVAKPAVGAGGRRLRRLARVEELSSCPLVGSDGRPVEDLVVQGFVPSVETAGEHSLVMIAGEPSHLVHEVPAAGEFRVQDTYGGTGRRVELDRWSTT